MGFVAALEEVIAVVVVEVMVVLVVEAAAAAATNGVVAVVAAVFAIILLAFGLDLLRPTRGPAGVSRQNTSHPHPPTSILLCRMAGGP